MMPIQPGDVPVTHADTSSLEKILILNQIPPLKKAYLNLWTGIKIIILTYVRFNW